MRKNIHNKIKQHIIDKDKETVWVYLKGSNTKSSSYDPYRNTGYSVTNQSPEPVEGFVEQIRANSLIIRDIGLTQSGAISFLTKESNIELFKICQKVEYDGNEYTPYLKALGNRVQIYDARFGFKRIVLFRRFS